MNEHDIKVNMHNLKIIWGNLHCFDKLKSAPLHEVPGRPDGSAVDWRGSKIAFVLIDIVC